MAETGAVGRRGGSGTACCGDLPVPGRVLPVGRVPRHVLPHRLAVAGGLYLIDVADICRPSAALGGDASALGEEAEHPQAHVRYGDRVHGGGFVGAAGRAGPAIPDIDECRGAIFVADGGLASGANTRPAGSPAAVWLRTDPDSHAWAGPWAGATMGAERRRVSG